MSSKSASVSVGKPQMTSVATETPGTSRRKLSTTRQKSPRVKLGSAELASLLKSAGFCTVRPPGGATATGGAFTAGADGRDGIDSTAGLTVSTSFVTAGLTASTSLVIAGLTTSTSFVTASSATNRVKSLSKI